MPKQSHRCRRWNINLKLENTQKNNNNKISKNGELLIEFCKLHNLLVINTIFKNKPSPKTWISSLPPIFPGKNPYRKQYSVEIKYKL